MTKHVANLETLPARLREARESAGLSVRDVVASMLRLNLDVSHATIANYETGKSCPRIDMLAALAGLYSRPITWFLNLGKIDNSPANDTCPFCDGTVRVSDCGYTTFNPGSAKCDGCKRHWSLGFVEDASEASARWFRFRPFAQELERLQQAIADIHAKIGFDKGKRKPFNQKGGETLG